MAEKNNAVCSICGRPYHICLSCKNSMSSHPWKVHTDTSEHYKVFQIIKGYNTNVYTKSEARYKLCNVDLSDLDTFRPHIKLIIEDILKIENKDAVEVLEVAKFNDVTVEEDNNKEESSVVIQKRNKKYKNKYNVEQ